MSDALTPEENRVAEIIGEMAGEIVSSVEQTARDGGLSGDQMLLLWLALRGMIELRVDAIRGAFPEVTKH